MNCKNVISIGDFFDVYYKIKSTRFRSLLNRFGLTKGKRIKNAWQHTEAPPTNWWSIPRVSQRRNRLITDNPNIELQDYIYKKYLKGKSHLRAVSPGCGTGTQEIKFGRYPCFALFEAFDTSQNRISEAIQEANKFNFTNLRFFVENVYDFHFGISNYDMILLHGSLHHFKHLDGLLPRIKESLTREGILVLYEYVGPNRFQWDDGQLLTVNKLLCEIPAEYRKRWNSHHVKKRQYRPGLLRMILSDPSEAVESENILPLLNQYFKASEIKNVGGNLLQPVLKDISHHFLRDEKKAIEVLEYLFMREDQFLKENKSDFVFGVFKK